MSSRPPDTVDDPGWRPAFRGLAWTPLPFVGVRRMQRQADKGRLDGLVALRSVFVSFAGALVLVGVVVVSLEASGGFEESLSVEWGAGLVVLVGAYSLVAPRLIRRPLDCTSDDSLASTYRTRFFLRIAFADAAGLVGLVAYIQTGNPLLYPLALTFTIVGFVRAAPSFGNLARDQHELTLSGCGRSLIGALRSSGSATR